MSSSVTIQYCQSWGGEDAAESFAEKLRKQGVSANTEPYPPPPYVKTVRTVATFGVLISILLLVINYFKVLPVLFGTFISTYGYWFLFVSIIGAQIAGMLSASGAFEVIDNTTKKVLFSKLNSGRYPTSVNGIVEELNRQENSHGLGSAK